MRRAWGEPPWNRERFRAHTAGDRVAKSRIAAAEVIVVGAGLTGLSAAYHLARRGVRTVVLESGLVGDGASGCTGGIVLEGGAAGPLEGADSCVSGLERLIREEEIACGLSLAGCWEIAHRCETPASVLPWDDEGAAVYVTKTVPGGTVEPAMLLAGLARAAARAGATIYEGTAVRRLLIEPEPALEIQGEVVRPAHVVLAVNAWINSLLAEQRPLTSALTFGCATEPLDPPAIRELGLGPGLPFYTTDLPYLWGRTISDGRLVFGSGLVFETSGDLLEQIDVRLDEPAATLSRLEARVRALTSCLNDVRFSARWAGPIAFTHDLMPLLGRLPACPRIMLAAGYAGHGVALTVRAGELLADAIVEGKSLPRWSAGMELEN